MSQAPEETVEKIKAVLIERATCMCGYRDRCEVCNEYSEYNKLRNKVYAAVYSGPKPRTLEAYGASMKIDLKEIL